MKDLRLFVFSSNRRIGDFYLNFEGGFAPNAMGAKDFFEACIGIKDRKKAPSFILRILLLQTLYEYKNTHHLLLFDRSFLAYLEGMEFLEKFFSEILLNQKKISDIQGLDIYEDYAQHLEILQEIYEKYQEKLLKYGFYGQYYGEQYKVFPEVFDRFERIEFFLDGILSRVEQSVLLEIAKYKKIFLHFSCDQFNKNFFNFLHLDFQENYEYIVELQELKILQKKQKSQIKPFELYSFNSRIAQISFVIDRAREWLMKERKNVALITPSEDFAKYLRVFDLHRNFNYAMGVDIKQTDYYKKIIQQETVKNIADLEKLTQSILQETTAFKEEISAFNQEFFLGLKQIDFAINFFDIKDINKFYQKELENLKLSDRNGGRIPVYGMLETRGMCFDCIIIVDFNEEKIFNFTDSDMFLNTKIRKMMQMPTLIDRQNLQKHYYYQLIQNAKEVAITYVEEEKMQAFHFLSSIIDVIPQKFNKSIFNFNQKKEYQEDKFITLIPKDFIFSAKSLRDFFDCKRRFFLRYLRKIKVENTQFILQNILHACLKESYQKYQTNFDIALVKKEFERQVLASSVTQSQKFELAILLGRMHEFWLLEESYYKTHFFYRAEYNFETLIFGKKFRGRIDRIDCDACQNYTIVDYKFGKKVVLEKPNPKLSDFQLVLYALALEQETKNVAQCFFYDMQSGQQIIENGLEEKKVILKNKIQELEGEIDFCKSDNHDKCRFCDYKILCDKG